MRILAWSALTFLACSTMASAGVPSGVFGGPAGCPNPIVQGEVDGQWVGLTYHFDGTNGGPDSIAVVTVGFGGNGALTTVLEPIKPEGLERGPNVRRLRGRKALGQERRLPAGRSALLLYTRRGAAIRFPRQAAAGREDCVRGLGRD